MDISLLYTKWQRWRNSKKTEREGEKENREERMKEEKKHTMDNDRSALPHILSAFFSSSSSYWCHYSGGGNDDKRNTITYRTLYSIYIHKIYIERN